MAGLSHARHDDPAGRRDDEPAGSSEVLAEALAQAIDGTRLDLEHLARKRNQFIVGQVFGHGQVSAQYSGKAAF